MNRIAWRRKGKRWWAIMATVALPCTVTSADILLVPSQHATIQNAIDASSNGDLVEIANGTYTGSGNKDLDFGGKAITVRSASGDPALCILDCDSNGRGFYFHSGEGRDSVVEGLRITNGYAVGADGGGICCDNSSPTLVICVFSENVASRGGGIACTYGSNPLLTSCIIDGNQTNSMYGGGGGMYCLSSSPTLDKCTISGNLTTWGGGGVACIAGGSPTLANCTIGGNTAGAGGGVYCSSCSPTLTNCTISGNSTTLDSGGGVYLLVGSPAFTNCTISGNTAAEHGGGISCSASLTLNNCTVGGNSAAANGGGLYCSSSNTLIANSVFWGNTPQEIYVYSGSLQATHSNVQGGTGESWFGTGCIDVDPLFSSVSDYHLLSSSPCIDAGSNSLVPPDTLDLNSNGNDAEPLPIDLDGNPRFVDGNLDSSAIVDMGAYEYQADCNSNGVYDATDVASGTSFDCDSNGIPDECQTPDGSLLAAWMGGASGDWSVASNWCPTGVPNNNGTEYSVVIVPGAQVMLDIDIQITALDVDETSTILFSQNPGTTLDVLGEDLLNNRGSIEVYNDGGSSTAPPILSARGAIQNSGIIKLNGNTQPSKFVPLVDSGASFVGTGELLLGGQGVAIVGASSREVENCSGHVIRGAGEIKGSFANHGEVTANIPDESITLDRHDVKVNDGLIQATDGGIVTIVGTLDQTSDGVLSAGTFGEIVLTTDNTKEAFVTGGTINRGDNGSVFLMQSSTIKDLTILGGLTVPGEETGIIAGTIKNTGTIELVGQGTGSTLEAREATAQLIGTGRVLLRSKNQASVLHSGGPTDVITNGPEHTIEGVGAISAALVNQGLVLATSVGGSIDTLTVADSVIPRIIENGSTGTLRASDSKILVIERNLTNNGLLEATSNGIVDIYEDVTGNGNLQAFSAGTVRVNGTPEQPITVHNHGLHAQGGTIDLNGATVTLGNGIDEPTGWAPNVNGQILLSSSSLQGKHGLVITGGITILQASTIEFTPTSGFAECPIVVCPDTAAEPSAIAELTVDSDSSITAVNLEVCTNGVLDIDGTMTFGGSVELATTDTNGWYWGPASTLEMTGGVGLPDHDPTNYVTLEVGGMDRGLDPSTHQGAPAGFLNNYGLTELIIGPGTHLSLVDRFDNGNRGGTGGQVEALYVDTLRFADTTGFLNLNGLHLYYNTIDPPSASNQMIDCRYTDGNCDGDVDMADFAMFQTCFGRGSIPNRCDRYDLNVDGDIDLQDYELFANTLSSPSELGQPGYGSVDERLSSLGLNMRGDASELAAVTALMQLRNESFVHSVSVDQVGDPLPGPAGDHDYPGGPDGAPTGFNIAEIGMIYAEDVDPSDDVDDSFLYIVLDVTDTDSAGDSDSNPPCQFDVGNDGLATSEGSQSYPDQGNESYAVTVCFDVDPQDFNATVGNLCAYQSNGLTLRLRMDGAYGEGMITLFIDDYNTDFLSTDSEGETVQTFPPPGLTNDPGESNLDDYLQLQATGNDVEFVLKRVDSHLSSQMLANVFACVNSDSSFDLQPEDAAVTSLWRVSFRNIISEPEMAFRRTDRHLELPLIGTVENKIGSPLGENPKFSGVSANPNHEKQAPTNRSNHQAARQYR